MQRSINEATNNFQPIFISKVKVLSDLVNDDAGNNYTLKILIREQIKIIPTTITTHKSIIETLKK